MTEPYFRQWLAGRDFATSNPVALQMRNHTYAIGDRSSGEAVLVDPAYDLEGLLALLETDGLRCVGAVATHYHFDHVGGRVAGLTVAGIARLVELVAVPVHANREEVPWLERTTSVREAIVAHDDRDVVEVGAVGIELWHTPGHTPGSQCLVVDGRLLTGDTLFLEGCGRTDLPGGDAVALHRSLTVTLAEIPGDVVVYPGHHYSVERHLPMAQVRERNPVLAPLPLEQWLASFT